MRKKEFPSNEEILSAIRSGKKFINDLLIENVRTRFRVKNFSNENILPEVDKGTDVEFYELAQHLEETYSFLTGIYGNLVEMEVYHGREE